ncbi:hypothetical protein ACIBJC_15100 [Streptomyces sp. NPDC050509]|uniref:hypothetical protein n=1 Tax=Streptomyces sp. NPDC050509 TaxID=3365620 RepID=UPI003790DAA7
MKKTDILKAVSEMESSAFRVGQVVRRLLAEEPALARSMNGIRTSVFHDSARIDVDLDSLDGVRVWAAEAGVEPVNRFHQYPHGTGYESLRAVGEADGVEMQVLAVKLYLSVEDWEARLAEAAPPEVTGRAA